MCWTCSLGPRPSPKRVIIVCVNCVGEETFENAHNYAQRGRPGNRGYWMCVVSALFFGLYTSFLLSFSIHVIVHTFSITCIEQCLHVHIMKCMVWS